MNNTIKDIINNYFKRFEGEIEQKNLLLEQLNQESVEEVDRLDNRRNFKGHLCASAFILNREKTKVLLIHHKKLKMLLQPGGHIDPFENPLDSCQREILEELGLSEMEYLPIDSTMRDLPFDIDSHYIPANLKKDESEHYHHDLRYLFIIDEMCDISFSKKELDGYQWVDIDSMETISGGERVKAKIKSYLTKT